MLKKILVVLILFIIGGTYGSKATSGWKMHPTFDEEVTHVIETPRYVYFTSRNIPEHTDMSLLALFRFDKEGEELTSLSTDNLLSSNQIQELQYNAQKGYIFILYKNYDIDLLHNDSHVTHIPYYEISSNLSSKNINSITFDTEKDRIYLATDFGILSINDIKGEIADSRIYDTPIQSFCRLGNFYLAIKDGDLWKASSGIPRNFDDFIKVDTGVISKSLYPLADDKALLIYSGDNKSYIKLISLTNGDLKIENKVSGTIINIENNKNGIGVTTHDKLYQFTRDGQYTFIDIPEEFQGCSFGYENVQNLWCGFKRKGLAQIKNSGGEFSLKRDFMIPNSPAVSFSTSFLTHPKYGLMTLNYGYTPSTFNLSQSVPLQLSSHSANRWENHAPAYTNPARTNIVYMSNGMAIDPQRPSLVYITSLHGGLLRLNLENPDDIIHMSRANDPDALNNGFITLIPAPKNVPSYANFSYPRFDVEGNLWMNFTDWDDVDIPNPHLVFWAADDRRATVSAQSARLPVIIEIDAPVSHNNRAFVLPLLRTGRGLLLHVGHLYDESVMIIDTKGTPLDTGDDIIYRFNGFYDADGNEVEVRQVQFAWEDPDTGFIWLGHLNGLCYFDPVEVINNHYQINRVKVARNDGTNLADYLLEGVTVTNITIDADGRKWFSTNGGGVVCTSDDGREIIKEFNSSNSDLPDDIVYGLAYDPYANSIMFSTAGGFAEYFLPPSINSSGKKDIKVFPNPVRPDFNNFVTISDIPQGSHVKIMDAGGNLVKDLGIMAGFEMLWDISNFRNQRVKSGVYYILISPGNESASFSKVGKILVIS